MSILRRTLRFTACALLAAFAVLAQAPTNLYLLPNSSSVSPTTASFRTDPFTIFSSFAVQPGASFLLMHPNGQKLYSVSRSGGDTLVTLDAVNPGTVLRRQSLGQAEAATLSPDGRRLLIAAGSLHILDTTNETVLASLSDVGNTPIDVAVSLDGSRAFVLSQASNRLTAVDLNTNTVAGSSVTVPGLSTGVAVAPNGLVYVSTGNLIQVIDGRTMTTVKEIPLNASPGKLVFTADGLWGLAVNRTPITGSSILMFDVAAQKLQGSIPNFQVTMDRLVVAGNNRIYALSSQTASLYEVTTSPLNINPPQFSGLGTLPNVTDMAVSNELPTPRFLFLSTPSSLYRFDLSSLPPLAAGQVAIPTQPGPLVHLSAQTTGTPTSVLSYNNTQSTAPGGTYRPLIVRALSSTGKPLYGVNVTFSSDNAGAQILGATTTTNAEGWAQTTVIAPTTAGTFNVTASVGPGPNQPTAVFTLTTSSGSTGGGGGATSLLSIASGQGQMVGEQFLLTEPMTVRLVDNRGNPVVGETITFTIANGNGTLATSTFDGTIIPNATCSGACTVTTDANGYAGIGFLASSISPGFSYSQQTISASNGQGTVNFIVTTLLSQLPGGGQAAQPLAQRIKPNDNVISAPAGGIVNEAIVVRVVATSGIQSGQPIPNVALKVRTDYSDPTLGPTATCVGDGGVAMTDATGLATCNLKAGGKLGRTQLYAVVGSALNLGGGSLTLEVLPGAPGLLRIVQGNNQSGAPGQRLPLAFLIEVQDGFGNVLPGQTVTWEVATPNSITLANVVSTSDANGRVSALGTLGSIAGSNQVRVKIGNITQTFNFTVNLTISQLNKLTGDGQTTLINQAFSAPLVVEVRDERGGAVPNQAVSWSILSGAATLSSASASTDAAGRSQVSVTAGGSAGTVSVRASLGSLSQTFTLTVRPPGPVFNASGIVTTARNQPGLVPCALATVFGSNIAAGINGVVNTNFLGIGGLPLTYNNLEVVIGGASAPILALSNVNGQESVVVQVPCEVAPGRTSVLIRITGASAQVDNVQVFRAAPGIFETAATASQRAYAAIIRPDGTYVTPTNPARRGEVVIAAVTGLGQTTPPAVTNAVGNGGQLVAAPLIVGVNDQGVRIVSASYAQGMIGVYWVAFEIPADAATGTYRSFSMAADNGSGDLVFSNSSAIAAIQ